MNIVFQPTKFSHTIGFNDGFVNNGTRRNFLCFDLAVKDNLSVFELGDSYVITSSYMLRTHHKNKSPADVSCTFKPLSSLSNDEKADLKISNSVIGYGLFFEESNSDSSSQPAALLFSIYVPDDDFNMIVKKLDTGNKCDSLTLSFEDESGKDSDKLKYGWEPDASRIIWNYLGDKRRSRLYLTSYDMSFSDTLGGSINAEEESIEKNFKLSLAKDLKEVKYALYVVAFASLLTIFSRFV